MTNKPPTFDLQKQKETCVQAKRELCDVPPLCSKDNDKGKGTMSIPLQSDPCAYVDQQLVVSGRHEEIESIGFVNSFLQSCLKLTRDERALHEMQSLIDKCEHPVSKDVVNKVASRLATSGSGTSRRAATAGGSRTTHRP